LGIAVERFAVCPGYGWDESYEALVAQIVARFCQNYDVKRWIKDGQNVGSVFW
jgi:hypothetical protein